MKPDWSKLFDQESYIARDTAINEAIQRYFWWWKSKRLILDVTRELTTEPVVSFLGMDTEYIRPMPHAQKKHI